MDVTKIILDDHRDRRRLFAMIEQIDPTDPTSRTARRRPALLDAHADADRRHDLHDTRPVNTDRDCYVAGRGDPTEAAERS